MILNGGPCREMVPGVSPTIVFAGIPCQTYDDLQIRVSQFIVFSYIKGCRQIILVKKVTMNQKRLKNTG